MPKNDQRTNTPTEQNKEDNTLVLYRLQLVEDAVKEVSHKMDTQDNIKKADLMEFRDTIITRFNEVREGLQKQIDDQELSVSKALEKKADQKQVDDLRTLIKSVATFLSTVIAGLVIFYLTKGEK
jgi:hypothetical protein